MKNMLSRSNYHLSWFTHVYIATFLFTKSILSVRASKVNEMATVDEAETRRIEQDKNFDDSKSSFDVFAYQCDVQFPHGPVDDIIYQGDHLGICVETRHPETYIDGIRDLELLQNDGFGGIFSSDPILAEIDNVMTDYDCTLENNIGKENSKCFIKTSMISSFFESELIVNVTGEVDLRISKNQTETRELYATTGSSITSEFEIQASVGIMDDSHIVEKAVFAGVLGLYLIYTAIKCFCCVAVKKVYKKRKMQRKDNTESVDNTAEYEIELNDNTNCIV